MFKYIHIYKEKDNKNHSSQPQMFGYLYGFKDPGKLPWIQGPYKHRTTIKTKFLTIFMYVGLAGNLPSFPDFIHRIKKNT